MIEDLAARQRAEAKAATQRRAKRQGDAAFWDGQGATDSGGNSIPVTTGSNGPLRLGQSTPLLRSGGSAQIDAFSAMRSDEPLIPVQKQGDITVLAAKVVGATTELWLGGDRKPQKIATINSLTIAHYSLELIGPNKTDWIVAIRHATTIEMFFGRHTEQASLNWTVTDARAAYLQYGGKGFWRSASPYSPNLGVYLTTQTTPVTDADSLASQLQLVQSGEHSRIEGATTIAFEYFENTELPTPSTLSSTGGTTRSGIQQIVTTPTFPFTFTGTNISESQSINSAYYEGSASGPGYLGPGGGTVNASDPPIRGTETLPRKRISSQSNQSKEASTQSVFFWAHNGVINNAQGTVSISGTYQTLSEPAMRQVRKINNWVGLPNRYNNPVVYLWTIFLETAEDWPPVPEIEFTQSNSLSINQNSPALISPTVTKTNSLTATAQWSSAAGTANSISISPGLSFLDGYSYQKTTRDGAATLNSGSGDVFSWLLGSTVSTQNFIVYQGQEIETLFLNANLSETWQPDSETGYPKFNTVTDFVPPELFSKSSIQSAKIEPKKGAMNNGKLKYTAQTKIDKKVLSMSQLGTVNTSILVAKCWDL